MIEFICPKCDQHNLATRSQAGERVACHWCMEWIRVPGEVAEVMLAANPEPGAAAQVLPVTNAVPAAEANPFAGIGNDEFSSGKEFLSRRLSHLYGSDSLFLGATALLTMCLPFIGIVTPILAVMGLIAGIRSIIMAARRPNSRTAQAIILATLGCVLNLFLLGIGVLRWLAIGMSIRR
jgi:hypothetical protein